MTVWTAAPPTEPGFYYLTTRAACCSEHPRRVRVVEVTGPHPGYPGPDYLAVEQPGMALRLGLTTGAELGACLWGSKVELPGPPDTWPPQP